MFMLNILQRWILAMKSLYTSKSSLKQACICKFQYLHGKWLNNFQQLLCLPIMQILLQGGFRPVPNVGITSQASLTLKFMSQVRGYPRLNYWGNTFLGFDGFFQPGGIGPSRLQANSCYTHPMSEMLMRPAALKKTFLFFFIVFILIFLYFLFSSFSFFIFKVTVDYKVSRGLLYFSNNVAMSENYICFTWQFNILPVKHAINCYIFRMTV